MWNSRLLRQRAVYWGPGSYDASGKPAVATPIQIRCRWEEINEEFIKATGEKSVSRAMVYVDRDLVAGGRLWLGLLRYAPANPYKDPLFVFEIQRFEKVPNTRATRYMRTAIL